MALSLVGAYFSGREEVTVEAVSLRDVYKIVEESGSVESKSAVSIMAKGSGTVSEILVQEGQSVSQGDLLVSFSDFSSASDVASIRAQAEGVYAQYLASKLLSDNNKMLYNQGAISYMEYTQSLALTQQLAAQLSSLGYSAQSLTNATAADGITAPIAGTVTAVYIKEGEWVGPGTPVAEVGGVDDRIISLHLISSDADLVSVGMKASIFSEGDLITENAVVQEVALKATDYISSLGIVQKRVSVEVSLPKEVTPRLGSNADVEIIVQSRKQVLSVPSKAVFSIEDQYYVYVSEKGKAVLTQVEIDLEGEEYTKITGGLTEGMKVIVSPSTDIGDGTRIKEKR
jgi:RND family efflux transporter MFP subunit